MERSRTTILIAAAVAILPNVAWSAGGQGYFSGDIYDVTWATNPSLTYNVTGAPPSVCGDLHTFRNGSWLTSPGWICTDANGNATKGPWNWFSMAADQTDDPAYIRWPDGSQTTPDRHIFDKTPYTPWRTSPNGSPPSSWYGEATDAAWGAGFDSRWSTVYSRFRHVNSDLYWNPSSGGYTVPVSAGFAAITVTGSLSGIPGFHAYWSSPFPPAGAHSSGQTYEWQTCINDLNSSTCLTIYQFTKP